MRNKIQIRVASALLSAVMLLSSSTVGGFSAFAEGNVSAPAEENTAVVSEIDATSDASSDETVSNTEIALEGGKLETYAPVIVAEGGTIDRVQTGGTMAQAGTVADPYQIADVADFLAMQNIINIDTNANKYFKLVADIDLSGITISDFTSHDGFYSLVSLSPSASASSNVFFHLDGDGKKIMNLDVTASNNVNVLGIFGYVNSNSTITNVEFENCKITCSYSMNAATSITAVQNAGTISDCIYTGAELDMTGASSSFTAETIMIGSVPVYSGFSIIASDNLGTISGNTLSNVTLKVKGGRKYIGSVAGQNRGSISNTQVNGFTAHSYGSSDTTTLNGNGATSSYVGGIVGYNRGRVSPLPQVTGCTVTLAASSTQAQIAFGDYVGGIAGYNSGELSECKVVGNHKNSDAAPTATSTDMKGVARFGGIAGCNAGTISGSTAYDIGMFFPGYTENSALGGISGSNSGSIVNCVSSGYVNGSGYTTVGMGGVVGIVLAGGTVTNCYTFVRISSGSNFSGAVLGRNGSLSYLGTTCYWSSAISAVKYACPSVGYKLNDLERSLKVINISNDASKTISKSSMTHSWGMPGVATVLVDTTAEKAPTSDNVSVTVANSADSFSVSGSAIGASANISYYANITFPSDVGTETSAMSQKFSVPLLITDTAAANAGLSSTNPIIISTYQQLRFIANASESHYALDADIVMTSGTWTPFVFGGTLDGNGHSITATTGLFTNVMGSRDSDIGTAGWETKVTNLATGYISDLDIISNSAISGSMLGTVSNATLSNVNYRTTASGSVTLSQENSGALISTVSGNTYVYDCIVSLPVNVTAASNIGGIGALIGTVAADNFIIDGCGTQSTVTLSSNLSGVAGLIGKVSSLTGTGTIRNCFASGRVRISGSGLTANAKIAIGAVSSSVSSNAGFTTSNTFFSIDTESEAGYTIALSVAPYTDGIQPWSFESGAYTLPLGSNFINIDLNLPSGNNTFDSATPAEFSFTVANSAAAEINCGTNNANISISSGIMTFGAKAKSTQLETFTTELTVVHIPTGLKAKTALRSGMRLVNGYYEIYTKQDLADISSKISSSADYSTYATQKYKICADIDMDGDTFLPIGPTSSYTFKGTFEGVVGSNGEKFTISNFVIGASGNNSASNSAVGLFGYTAGATIKNFDIDDATVTNSKVGGTAALVGSLNYSGTRGGVIENIDITNSTISSTYTTLDNTVDNGSYTGALVGRIVNNSSSCISTIRDITVKDTSVTGSASGSVFIGGVIGGGTGLSNLVLGEAYGEEVTEASIVVDNVTVSGYRYVGGVIGMIGGIYENAAYTGGYIRFNGIEVKNSEITANLGLVGGIVGCSASTDSTIDNCTVSSTNIFGNASEGALAFSDVAGIAAYYTGTITNCTVEDSDIEGLVVGGILGRKTDYIYNPVIIEDCNVIGNTTIKRRGTTNDLSSAGGIVASLLNYDDLTVSRCGVGEYVSVSGCNYNGGIIGDIQYADSYAICTIEDCITYATVDASSELSGEYAGGIIGYVSSVLESLSIKNCVVGGNDNGGYIYGDDVAGGIVGYLLDYYYGGAIPGYPIIENCTVTAKINIDESGASHTSDYGSGKIIGCLEDTMAFTDTNINSVISGIVLSSYPQAYPAYGNENVEEDTNAMLTYTDVNMPYGKYLNNQNEPLSIDGSVSQDKTISISNQARTPFEDLGDDQIVVGYSSDGAKRLVFNTESNASEGIVNGWKSIASRALEITSATVGTESTPANVSVTAHSNSQTAGIVGAYDIYGVSIPGTDNPAQVRVKVSIVSTNIPLSVLQGAGTVNNPYVITTKDELDSIRDRSMSSYYVLGNDIVFTESDFVSGGDFYNDGQFFVPIGYNTISGVSTTFTGGFSCQYNGIIYSVSGIKINSDSNETGLFAKTNGASFTNIYFENSSIISSGNYVGVVTGYAEATVFSSNSVKSSSIVGSLYAGTLAGYALNANVTSCAIEDSVITSATYIGGVFGHANQTSASPVNSITNTTVTDFIGTTTISSSVQDIAAGVVGEFSGTMSNVTVNGTGSVTGSRASGAIGLIDVFGISSTSVSDVTVTGNYSIISPRATASSAAAGVVAKIKNTTSAASVTVSISGCSVGSGIIINAQYYAGGIVGHSGLFVGSVSISDSSSTATVIAELSENDAYDTGTAAAIIAYARGAKQTDISRVNAGGTVRGAQYAAGIIGDIGALESLSGDTISFVSNSTVSSSVAKSANSIQANYMLGIIIANANATVFSSGTYTVAPFDNVYYSSYQFETVEITGSATVNANADLNFEANVCDMQGKVMFFDGANTVNTIGINGNSLTLTSENMPLQNLETGAFTGDFTRFTAQDSVEFVLKTISSKGIDGTENGIFTYDTATNTMNLNSEGDGVALLEYENGLTISLSLSAYMLMGTGISTDPYIINSEQKLCLLRTYPTAYFKLAADLEFSAAWRDSSNDPWSPVPNFTGSFVGGGYVYENGAFTSEPYEYSISGLTYSDSTSLETGCLVKKLTGGTISGIKFENCSSVSTASGTTYNGIVAGYSTGTISGNTVTGSTVTGGYYAGAVAGYATSVTTCTISSSCNVEATNYAGGIAGWSNNITDCSVTGSQIATRVATGTTYAGGIVGKGCNVTECNVVSVTVDSGNAAGIIATLDANRAAPTNTVGCNVSGTTVITGDLFAAGVMANALGKTGTYTTSGMLTITDCVLEEGVTILATGISETNGSAGGMLGYLDRYFAGLTITDCETYATITSNGNDTTSAAAGIVAESTTGYSRPSYYIRPKNFTVQNCVTGGSVTSKQYAGGILGYFAAQGTSSYKKNKNDVPLVSDCIVSSSISSPSDNLVGLLAAYCSSALFTTSGATATTANTAFVNNYYSSYTTSYNNIQAFSEGAITAMGVIADTEEELEGCVTDVAYNNGVGTMTVNNTAWTADTAYGFESIVGVDNSYYICTTAHTSSSDFTTDESNWQLLSLWAGGVPFEVGEYRISNGVVYKVILAHTSQPDFADDLDANRWTAIGVAEGYTNKAVFIHRAAPNNVNYRPVKVQIKTSDGTTVDIGSQLTPAISVHMAEGVSVRDLSVKRLYVNNTTYYTSESENYYSSAQAFINGRATAKITTIGTCTLPCSFVVSLGYGLEIGIPVSSSPDGVVEADGSADYPYLISSASQFASYFFGSWAKDTTNKYLSKYYKQTRSISFTDILTEIAALDPSTARATAFAPIGTSSEQFVGGYDGNEKVISDFTYVNASIRDVGLFGYVSGDSKNDVDYRLRNIHIELAPGGVSGNVNVGGLVGYYESTCKIYNCSVVYSQVIGNDKVGGLVGYMFNGALDGCFTSCNVSVNDTDNTTGLSYSAGGLVGYFNSDTDTMTLSIDRCFSSSDVVANRYVAGFVGKVTYNLGMYGADIHITDSFFTGSVTSMFQWTNPGTDPATILVGFIDSTFSNTTQPYVFAENVYIAGSNTTRNFFTADGYSYYATLYGVVPEMAGSSNIYYDATVIGNISVPLPTTVNPTLYPYILKANGEYKTGDGVTDADFSESTAIEYSTTATLTSAEFRGLGTECWTYVAESYPRLTMRDSYSHSFMVLSTLPLQIDDREEYTNLHDGIMYPTSISDKLPGTENTTISVASSTFSSATDTVAYDENYDINLFGNGPTGAIKNVDVLFRDDEDCTTILRNSYLRYDTSVSRDIATPYVTVTAEIGGMEISRNMRILQKSVRNTYYIATERQLRAIMNSKSGSGHPDSTDGTKFAIYSNVCGNGGNNIRISADIEMNGSVSFEPITDYMGQFYGNNCSISNLYINNVSADNVGMFRTLTSTSMQNINGVIFENPIILGKTCTGTLVGTVSGAGVLINNCVVVKNYNDEYETNPELNEAYIKYADSKVSGLYKVGGLIGEMQAGRVGYESNSEEDYTRGQVSGTKINVDGLNLVGGFVGYATGAHIANGFATGNVSKTEGTSVSADAGTSDNAFGGFVGKAETGAGTNTIVYAFATGNVVVDLGTIKTNGQSLVVGIGGFCGLADIEITNSFSSGSVIAGLDEVQNSGVGTASIGVGGLVGYSKNKVVNSYSSSAVEFDYTGAAAFTSVVYAGVGGVCGIVNSAIAPSVSYVYASGSLRVSHLNMDYLYYGGVIGRTIAGIASESTTFAYYDEWTNNITSLTAVGGNTTGNTILNPIADTETVKGCTTDQFCNGDLIASGGGNGLPSSYWGSNDNAYPYLKEMFNDIVSDYVRYPAVLSVIAVRPNDRDKAAREDNMGYSMAMTMPTSLDISGSTGSRRYYLKWIAGSEIGGNASDYAGGIIQYGSNTFAPVRTSNSRQYLNLVVWVEKYSNLIAGAEELDAENNVIFHTNDGAEGGYREFAERSVSKLFEMMLGTEDYPYLISSTLDLQHIYFTNGTTWTSSSEYSDIYAHWFSPITTSDVNIPGVVHYKLISNIDMTVPVTMNSATNEVTIGAAGTNATPYVIIGSMASNTYQYVDPDSGETSQIQFQGFSLDGNDYAIDKFTSNVPFVTALDSTSTIKNIIFNNVSINGSGNIAIVRANSGKIDGVMVYNDAEHSISTTNGNAAAIVVYNGGMVKNCFADTAVTAAGNNVYVGGIVADNSTTITRSLSVGALTAGDGVIGIGAIAGKNSGTTENSLSLGSVTGNATTYTGGIVGDNTGTIKESSTRTEVTGSKTGDVIYAGSMVGRNNGSIVNSFAAGTTTISGLVAATEGSALYGTGTGTVDNAYADKALLGTNTYMLLGNSAVTEQIINGKFDNDSGFTMCAAGDDAYPQISEIVNIIRADGFDEWRPSTSYSTDKVIYYNGALYACNSAQVSGTTFNASGWTAVNEWASGASVEVGDLYVYNETVYRAVNAHTTAAAPILTNWQTVASGVVLEANDYVMIKYRLLQSYSAISSATVDSAYAQYIDTLSSGSNSVSTLDSEKYTVMSGASSVNGGTITSGNGTITVSTAAPVMTKVGAGSNIQDEIVFNPSFSFDYSSGTQNPNFLSGDGSVGSPYIINNTGAGYASSKSFGSLAYFGQSAATYFNVATDVNFGESEPYAPIEEFRGNLNGLGHVVTDVIISKNNALIGSLEPHSSVSNLGIAGFSLSKTFTQNMTDPVYFGILAAKADNATVTNSYAVGNLTVQPGVYSVTAHVGGLVGYSKNSSISNCVSSGKIMNYCSGTGSTIGGISGLTDTATINNCESTAYVYGLGYVGGIAGRATNTSVISNVIFAGTVADSGLTSNTHTALSSATVSNILASNSGSAVSSAYYDKQLSLFTENTYNAVATFDLIRLPDASTLTGWTEDTLYQKYPNPISAIAGQSNRFTTGLDFAIVRITVSLAGGQGSMYVYDSINVPTPVNTLNSNSNTVSIIENRTRFGDGNVYLRQSGTALVPDTYAVGFTGIKVMLSRGLYSSFEETDVEISRYIEPWIVRIIKVEYNLIDGNVSDSGYTNTTPVAVLVSPDMADASLAVSSSAITDANSDMNSVDDVVFQKIVVSGDGVSVDGLLPSGYAFTVVNWHMEDSTGDESNTATAAAVNAGGTSKYYADISDYTDHDTLVFDITVDKNQETWGIYESWSSLRS